MSNSFMVIKAESLRGGVTRSNSFMVIKAEILLGTTIIARTYISTLLINVIKYLSAHYLHALSLRPKEMKGVCRPNILDRKFPV